MKPCAMFSHEVCQERGDWLMEGLVRQIVGLDRTIQVHML